MRIYDPFRSYFRLIIFELTPMNQLLLFICLLACYLPTYAQEAIVVEKGKVLLDGYDPVAYFISGKPTPGEPEITHLYEGRIIRFASEENRKLFLDNPGKYFPAYGGWCAIALVDGLFVVPDYTLYKIQDGQLLFFQIKAFFNGKTLWEKNPGPNKLKADSNYLSRFPE